MIWQALLGAESPGKIRACVWTAAGWAILAAAAVFPWVSREPLFRLRLLLAAVYGLGAVMAAAAAVAMVRARRASS